MPKTVVAEQCGAPTRQGGRPKVTEGLSTVCSAPCELRNDLVVFYSCASTVAFAEPASEAHGCIFTSGAEAQ